MFIASCGEPTPTSSVAEGKNDQEKIGASGSPCTSRGDALAQLPSYRYEYSLKAAKVDAAAPQTETIQMKGERLAPDRERFSLIIGDQKEQEFLKVGDRGWRKDGDRWITLSRGALDPYLQLLPLQWWQETSLRLLEGSSILSSEVREGLPVWRCSSPFKGWGGLFGNPTVSQGEVWLAQEGGWPLAYRFSGTKRSASGETQLESTLQVTHVNSPAIRIVPPG